MPTRILVCNEPYLLTSFSYHLSKASLGFGGASFGEKSPPPLNLSSLQDSLKIKIITFCDSERVEGNTSPWQGSIESCSLLLLDLHRFPNP